MIRLSPIHVTAIVLLAVSSLAVTGCGGASNEETTAAAASPVPVTTVGRSVRIETLVVSPTSFVDVIELTGSVEASNDAVLSAEASGTLLYRAPRGAYVGKGGVVAQIDSTLLYAGYMQAMAVKDAAKAQYDLSKDTHDRQAPLYQDSIISANEYERVRAGLNQSAAQLRQSEAALAQLREQLDNTRVTAPFGGYVEEHMAEVGEQVMLGAPVARLVNSAAVKVAAGVPERYASTIRKGTPVEIEFGSNGDGRTTAAVEFVGGAIDAASRTFPIEVRVENRDGVLKPEMTARLFVTRDRLADVLVVPQTAILLDESGYGAFVVGTQDGKRVANRRSVSTGASYGGYVVITSGIEAGEEVVILGQQNLTEGDAVEVVSTTETASLRLVSTE